MAAEVFAALKCMDGEKASGADGFPPLFYQKFWSILGTEVTSFCLNVLNNQGDVSVCNHTLIALIPKVKQVRKVSNFRTISLCSTLYKIITKCLANRLKESLSNVISDNQSAFVPGRLISDNILAAFELLHLMKKQKGNMGSAAIKLDMSKAYDRVEWPFLRAVMERMSFGPRWVHTVMSCISTASYSFIVNDKVEWHVTPSRGLCQGCPLSPYLFLLIGETLSRSLCRAADLR